MSDWSSALALLISTRRIYAGMRGHCNAEQEIVLKIAGSGVAW